MKVASGGEMRNLDKMTIEETGIPGIVLMENASRAVCNACMDYLVSQNKSKAVVICGGGNNGGDGFAVARLLKNNNINVKILLLAEDEKIRGDARINFEVAKKMGIPISTNIDETTNILDFADIIIDAIFGTGFNGEPRKKEAYVIGKINMSGKYVISIDIASGVDADTGKTASACVQADETVTFALPKIGNILYPGGEKCGEIKIADISIPQENIQKANIKTNVLTDEMAKNLLPIRKVRSNKGTFGRLFIFAGSKDMPGAGVLCCKSAYKSGCGLIYASMPENCSQVVQSIVPEVVFNPIKSENGKFYKDSLMDIETLENAQAVIIGPGIGQGEGVLSFVEGVFEKIKCPVLIDADGLNAIARKKEILNRLYENQAIITPHPQEMSRLTGISVKEILNNTIKVAGDFAREYNTVVVLKDARTVVASPNGDVFINVTGNNSMAKAGSGDVLSGIIGGFLSQGMNTFEASILGVYIHGKAGDLAAKELGHYGVLASELADFIAFAIKEIEK